jgi:glycosidase
VSPLFGTEESFEALLARAQRHGIAVVMDLVLNHASVQHPDFPKSRERHAPEHRDFVWQEPIRVSAGAAAQHPALHDAYVRLTTDDGRADEAAYRHLKARVDREGLAAVPHIRVPLRDAHGRILPQRDPRDGHELAEALTVALYPLPENAQWSHGVLYTDHHTLWVPYPHVDQDGQIVYPPSNAVSLVTNQSAWVLDAETGQVYKAFFAPNQPDFAIGNPGLNAKLIAIAEYWITKNLAGFRLDAFRLAGAHPLLAVDGEAQRQRLEQLLPEAAAMTPLQRQLTVAGIVSNPPNTLRGLFQDEGWESPSPTQAMLDALRRRYPVATRGMDQAQVGQFASQLAVELPQQAAATGTLFPPGWRAWIHRDIGLGLAFWQEFKARVTAWAGRPVFLQAEFGDDVLLAAHFHRAGTADCFYTATYDQVHTLREVRTATEHLLQAFPQGIGVDLEPTNHDTPRGFHHLIAHAACSDEEALAFRTLFWQFLSRVPCSQLTIYTGEELGLPNPDGASVRALSSERDIGGTLSYIHPDSNDCNTGRATIPRDAQAYDGANLLAGQGATYRPAQEWQALTYAAQRRNPDSALHAIRRIMQRRAQDPVLSCTGDLHFLDYPFTRSGMAPDEAATCAARVFIYTRANPDRLLAHRDPATGATVKAPHTYLFVDNFHPTQELRIDVAYLAACYPDAAALQALIAERTTRAPSPLAATVLTVPPLASVEIGRGEGSE